MKISRGQVWWCNFSGGIGGEIIKKRPAIIISNDKFNSYVEKVQVIPLTSNIKKCYPGETIVQVNGRMGKAIADQIRTLDQKNVLKYLSDLLPEDRDRARAARGRRRSSGGAVGDAPRLPC